MKVLHLSHTDLDGFVCQFLAREFFEDISFFNANYGKEINVRLNQMLDIIESEVKEEVGGSFSLGARFGNAIKSSNKYLLLISDLNLSLQECMLIEERIKTLDADITLKLLDHHISAREYEGNFKWYFLDENRCASKIVWDWLITNYKLINTSRASWLEKLVAMTNSVDIWREKEYGFEFGKVAMGLISGSNEVNRYMFGDRANHYKFELIEAMSEFLGKENDAVEFDNALYRIKKQALGGNPNKQTMDYIISNFQSTLLADKKQECTISYGDKKGFLSYGIGGISVVANLFLERNSEYDFFMDIGYKGNVSLRSNGRADVSLICKEYFNGGGHMNASGGRLDGFKESFFYEDIKEQVINRFKQNPKI